MGITIRGTATAWAAVNATTQTVTLPTHVAGDMLIVRAGCKPYTAAITCGTAGWKPVEDQHTSGAVANGAGVGSLALRAFWKIATSAAETDPVVTWGTTAAPGAATAVVYQKSAGEHWIIPTGSGGADNTADTGTSATIDKHIPAKVDDVIDFFSFTRDNCTMTAPVVTQAGISFTATSHHPATALTSTLSNDISADGGLRIAQSGASTAAAVVTGTLDTSETKAAWATRLRVVAAASPLVQAKIKVGGSDPEVEAFGTTIVLTLDADITVGNLLAVWAFYGGTIANFTSIADNLGNTYSLVRQENPSGGGEDTHSMWTAQITTGGACTITITLGASVGYRSMLVHEVEGRHTSAPVDVHGFNFQATPTTATDNITSGANTTTVDGCYIFGVTSFEQCMQRGVLPGTNFAEVLSSPGTGVSASASSGAIGSEEFVQTTAGSIAATFTLVGTSAPSLTMMMALKPVTAAIEGTVTEAGSAADTQAASSVFSAARVETGAAADTPAASAVFAADRAETGAAADTQAAGAAYPVARVEVGAAADTPNASALFASASVEAGSAAEAQDAEVVQVITGAVVEAGSAVDAPAAIVLFVAAAAETGGAVDTPAASAVLTVARAEVAAASDTPQAGLATPVAVVEAGASVDTTGAYVTRAASIAEVGGAADTSTAAAAFVGARAETVSATDTQAAGVAYPVARIEAAAAVETPAATVAFSASAAESGAAVDAPAAAVVFVSAIAETGSAQDTIDADTQGNISGTVDEAGAATDTQTVTAVLSAAQVEVGTAAETVTGQRIATADRAEAGSVLDTVAADRIAVGVVAEAGAATATQSAVAALVAALAETGNAVDVRDALRIVIAARDEIGAADDTRAAIVALTGNVEESAAAVDTVVAMMVLIAAVEEMLNALDTVDFASAYDPEEERMLALVGMHTLLESEAYNLFLAAQVQNRLQE